MHVPAARHGVHGEFVDVLPRLCPQLRAALSEALAHKQGVHVHRARQGALHGRPFCPCSPRYVHIHADDHRHHIATPARCRVRSLPTSTLRAAHVRVRDRSSSRSPRGICSAGSRCSRQSKPPYSSLGPQSTRSTTHARRSASAGGRARPPRVSAAASPPTRTACLRSPSCWSSRLSTGASCSAASIWRTRRATTTRTSRRRGGCSHAW